MVSRIVRISCEFLAIGLVVAALQQPVAAKQPVATKGKTVYKSCTYPKSTAPAKPYVPKAKSWTEKGVNSLVKGIDISQWQHTDNKAIDFASLKNTYGASFVFIKSSDGGNRDKGKSAYWYPIDSKAAKDQGLIVGAYHYAVPGMLGTGDMLPTGAKKPKAVWNAKVKTALENRTNDAKLQAAMAYKQSGNNPKGDLPLTLDIEERPCGWSWQHVAAWSRDFLLEYEKLSGRKPIVYCNGYMINKLVANKVADPNVKGASFDFSKYPLWVAQWSLTQTTNPPAVGIWADKWTFWQFSSDGALKDAIPTIPSARTDLDVFNGSLESLQALANQ